MERNERKNVLSSLVGTILTGLGTFERATCEKFEVDDQGRAVLIADFNRISQPHAIVERISVSARLTFHGNDRGILEIEVSKRLLARKIACRKDQDGWVLQGWRDGEV